MITKKHDFTNNKFSPKTCFHEKHVSTKTIKKKQFIPKYLSSLENMFSPINMFSPKNKWVQIGLNQLKIINKDKKKIIVLTLGLFYCGI